MDTLLIPCWRRGEFLWHTLDNLVKTGDLSTIHVICKPDWGYTQDITTVIKEYADRIPHMEIAQTRRVSYRLTKQSHNLLTGYAYAASISTGLVFMVEEDVMVARDFFKFHRAIHAQQPGLFTSLSVKNINRQVYPTTDHAAYYLSHNDYCSLGVCMRREVIRDHIMPHANERYYRDPIQYCLKSFPGSVIGKSMAEQDGLIRRIQEARPDMPTAYPHVPRAFHAGFYGYNRPKHQMGDLKKKTEHVRTVIYSQENMKRNSLVPAYYLDSIPVPLDLPPWTTLKEVPV